MTLDQIHELEAILAKEKIESAIKQARYENRQKVLSLGIYIITEQMRVNTLALFLRG